MDLCIPRPIGAVQGERPLRRANPVLFRRVIIFSLKYPQISDIIYMGSYGINTIKDRVSEA